MVSRICPNWSTSSSSDGMIGPIRDTRKATLRKVGRIPELEENKYQILTYLGTRKLFSMNDNTQI